MDIFDNRLSNIESFIQERIEVDKIIDNKCQALLRFKSPQKEEILHIIKDCIEDFDIINNNDELVIMVYANSEYEINNMLCLIRDKGYCKESSKILKIS